MCMEHQQPQRGPPVTERGLHTSRGGRSLVARDVSQLGVFGEHPLDVADKGLLDERAHDGVPAMATRHGEERDEVSQGRDNALVSAPWPRHEAVQRRLNTGFDLGVVLDEVQQGVEELHVPLQRSLRRVQLARHHLHDGGVHGLGQRREHHGGRERARGTGADATQSSLGERAGLDPVVAVDVHGQPLVDGKVPDGTASALVEEGVGRHHALEVDVHVRQTTPPLSRVAGGFHGDHVGIGFVRMLLVHPVHGLHDRRTLRLLPLLPVQLKRRGVRLPCGIQCSGRHLSCTGLLPLLVLCHAPLHLGRREVELLQCDGVAQDPLRPLLFVVETRQLPG
mmetsp:Transcript_21048/g.49935  ORF Transcript_21048/g.49935 Transcript_21048/m.49935 type:complete len:337 (+) Transcript_21048:420-1430(+)